MISINVLGLVASFFLPSRDEVLAQKKTIEDRLDKKFGNKKD
jgi:hypothetical protein